MANETACKQCVFAIYEGLTQKGCKHGMLAKYKLNGDKIEDCYDEQAEFSVIRGRNCPYYRTPQWASKFNESADLDAVNRVLHHETRLGFNIIMYIPSVDIDLLTATVNSLVKQEESPSHATLVIDASQYSTSLLQVIKTIFFDYKGKWSVRFMKTSEKPRKVNHLVNKTNKCQYMVFADIGYEFDDDFFKNINDSIIDELVQFAAIEPDTGSEVNGLVIPKQVYEHWYTMGRQELSIYENIKEYECEQENNSIMTMDRIKLAINPVS